MHTTWRNWQQGWISWLRNQQKKKRSRGKLPSDSVRVCCMGGWKGNWCGCGAAAKRCVLRAELYDTSDEVAYLSSVTDCWCDDFVSVDHLMKAKIMCMRGLIIVIMMVLLVIKLRIFGHACTLCMSWKCAVLPSLPNSVLAWNLRKSTHKFIGSVSCCQNHKTLQTTCLESWWLALFESPICSSTEGPAKSHGPSQWACAMCWSGGPRASEIYFCSFRCKFW